MGQIDEELFDASQIGDLEKAKRAIENGANVNVKDYYGWTPLHEASEEGYEDNVYGNTPLHWASWNGHESIVSLLLENGANVNAKSNSGVMPLHYASNKSVVLLLLENGADVNAKTNDGWTPLHCSSEYGHESIVSLLLEKGADVNANDKDKNGNTPLHYASSYGHESIASLLLENGADPTIINNNGKTPLQLAQKWRKQKDLLTASKNGDLEMAKWALEEDIDVNVNGEYGRTPLHEACQNGHEAIVSLLLEKDADVNAKDNEGCTPLHAASQNRHESIVSLLLEKGGDVNAKDTDGETPLHEACQNGHEAVVSLLLENGADVNAKSNYGWTPLHWASEYGHESVVSLLLKKGADVNAKDNGGETPLHKAKACYYGHENIVSFLLQNGANPTVTNYEGKTPVQIAQEKNKQNCVAASEQFQPLSLLLDASKYGDLEKAKRAIRSGADINAKNRNGCTPLHEACQNGHEPIVSLLLEKGADVNVKDTGGETPLHEACQNGHESIVSLLLEKSADVNVKDTGGETPLHKAGYNAHEAIGSLLLENGANVNAKSKYGYTPLLVASQNGHDSVISLLLEKGADINVKTKEGYMPLHYASQKGSESIVLLLVERGANVNGKNVDGKTPLHKACEYGKEAIVSLLLEKGGDVNAKSNYGWTPLHWASEYGHESVVSLLLKKGADVNAKSNSGKTSLNDACRSGKVTVVAILLHNGADVNVKDIGGETPLHDACEHGDEAVVSLLLDNGADVNVKNKIGWTPLHYACRSGRVAVVSLLLEKGADSTITNNNGKTPLQMAQGENKRNCVAVFEEFAPGQQEKKRLESQEVKAHEEAKQRLQPEDAVASAKKKKNGSMELELAERGIYNRALAEGNTTLGRIRLMMCGPYGVGKTSIVRSLRGEPFNYEYNSTEGIDAVGRVDKHTLGNDLDFKQASRQWIMKNQSFKSNNVEPLFEDSKNRRRQDLKSFVVFPKQSLNSHFKEKASNPELKPSQKPKGNGICITIWDFAGQIQYHCMHQMFFRSNCLYLLVFDLQMDGSGRRSSELDMLLDAQKWLNAIVSSAGPEIGLIVVGTHADAFESLNAAKDRLEGLLEKLEDLVVDVEYDYVLRHAETAVVDNKNGFGISELKSNLYKIAKGLLCNILVPLSWLRLLEKVREELPLKDDQICAPLQKIQNLAKTIGIMEMDQLCAALSFFDRVGELTYIRERELRDWVFTEPQLLLNAMKSLLVPARNLKKFLQRKQQRELEDYGFLENEALKAIWNQYKNQEQLRHLMAAMGLIIEFPDGVAIPCRLPKKPTLWEDKPLEKEIVVTTKYSTRLPPSLYGHALAGLLRHHGTPGQGLRLLSQTTSCIEIDSSKCFLQNNQDQHGIALRAILQNEQAQHAIALQVRASPASSHMPDETVLVETLVRTVKALVLTLHSLERDRFEWMMLQSCVQLRCCEFTILESKRMSESYSANFQDSFLCPHKIPIEPYRTYLYRNKVLVIMKVTTQDTPKLVSKELCHRLYRNPKLPTNTVRQSTATSQFNRSPRVAPNAFKQLVIVQKHTLTPTRIIKPPISSVREVPPRRLP